MTAKDQDAQTLIRVVSGKPDATELAAVIAVVATSASRESQPSQGQAAPRSAWGARSRMVQPPLHPGPSAWRASAWPR
ncbi:MAG: acyl-CoA carboxylase subunit epsilon [Candidatus Nanopelagicales bacterium]